MSGFLQLIGDWHFWSLVGAYWIFTASIENLPAPDGTEKHPKLYAWAYKTTNQVAGNLKKAAAAKIPGQQP